ncbi:MAG TPA: hypothetical protein PKM78_00735 [Anaerolineae bacterium]|nr:hypothetical protein [Anaerolineae bacterium]HNU02641.1 hypothetical protein [Anaerolineae bacterium]
MLPLAQRQSLDLIDPTQRFWIDPAVETALTAQINEHFPKEAHGFEALNHSHILVQMPALMDCYNQDTPHCLPGLPSFSQNGGASG